MELTLFLFWAFVMLLNALFAVKAELVALISLFWKLAVPSRAGPPDQMDKKSGIWQIGLFFFFLHSTSGLIGGHLFSSGEADNPHIARYKKISGIGK